MSHSSKASALEPVLLGCPLLLYGDKTKAGEFVVTHLLLFYLLF